VAKYFIEILPKKNEKKHFCFKTMDFKKQLISRRTSVLFFEENFLV